MGDERVVVFDIGGRGGVHRCWDAFGFPLLYCSFEPDHDEFVRLSTAAGAARSDRNVYKVFNNALDEKSGRRELKVYSNRAGCSFFTHVPDGCYRFANMTLESTLQVQTTSLSDLAEKEGFAPDFIALDIEGAELGVLRGGADIIRNRTLGIRCEVEFSHVYEGAPEFYEVVGYLRSLGYKLCRIESCNAGMYGITTDMNRFSVSPMDAMPLTADMIFLNERLLGTLGEGSGDARTFMACMFALHNGCGYRAMDYIEKAVRSGGWSRYLAENPGRAEAILHHLAAYFSIPRRNINKNFDAGESFRNLFGRRLEDVLATVAEPVRVKISGVYNDEQLFLRVISPERQYDTTDFT